MNIQFVQLRNIVIHEIQSHSNNDLLPTQIKYFCDFRMNLFLCNINKRPSLNNVLFKTVPKKRVVFVIMFQTSCFCLSVNRRQEDKNRCVNSGQRPTKDGRPKRPRQVKYSCENLVRKNYNLPSCSTFKSFVLSFDPYNPPMYSIVIV